MIAIGTLPVPPAVVALLPDVLATEIGEEVVSPLRGNRLDRLAEVTFGVAADKAVRDHWVHELPDRSFEWPPRYVEYVNAEIASSKVRLGFHELAMRALIQKVKGRCWRVHQANRTDRPEGFVEFTVFVPGFKCTSRCEALGRSCFRTAMFDWDAYLSCAKVDCHCNATPFNERAAKRLIASGVADRTNH